MLVLSWNPYHGKVVEISDKLTFTERHFNFLSIMEKAVGFPNTVVRYLTHDAIEGPNAVLYKPIVSTTNRKSTSYFVEDAKCFIAAQHQKEVEYYKERERIKGAIIGTFGDDRNEWNEIVDESCPSKQPFPLLAILSHRHLYSVLIIFKEEGEWKAVVKAHGNQMVVPVSAMVYPILEDLNISHFNFITEKEDDPVMACYKTCAKFFDGNKEAQMWMCENTV